MYFDTIPGKQVENKTVSAQHRCAPGTLLRIMDILECGTALVFYHNAIIEHAQVSQYKNRKS